MDEPDIVKFQSLFNKTACLPGNDRCGLNAISHTGVKSCPYKRHMPPT